MNNQDNNSGWKTRQEIAKDLNLSVTTLWRKLKTLGITPPAGLLSPIWQKTIIQALNDWPLTPPSHDG